MFAVAMQVLAGNPQSLFYTAVAAAVYCALCAFQARARRPFLLGLGGIVLGGAALSATYVTKKPILFVGTGQGYADLVPFDPDWMLRRLFTDGAAS